MTAGSIVMAVSEHIVSGIIQEPAASHCAAGSIHLSGVSPMRQQREYVPCFCDGPWEDEDGTAQVPSLLEREHETGRYGCRYPRQPEWMRRARENRLPSKDLTRV